MILATVFGLSALGQVLLPGSKLSLEQAKEEAHSVVVAEVGKTAEPIGGDERSILLWTEIRPSETLKGNMTPEGLNKLPLMVLTEPKERLPKNGETFIFFIGNALSRSPIAKVLPVTAENIEAVRNAKPYRPDVFRGGLGGGGLGGGGRVGPASPLTRGGGPQPIAAPSLPYRGTNIHPGPDLVGEEGQARRAFAAAMSEWDPKPEDRQAHFAWVFRNETVRRYGVRQVGWWGSVTKAEPRPGGGWLVRVSISPWLQGGLRFNHVGDSVEETYEFVDGGIRLVGSDSGTEKSDRHIFPVAL